MDAFTQSGYSCPNESCPDYLKVDSGNISKRGFYGVNKDRILLYCRTCGKRFSSTYGSSISGLHLPPDKILSIIHHAVEGNSVRGTARLLKLDKDTVKLKRS
jgi:transposase-like protein